MKPHPTILLLLVAAVAMGAAGTIYYETLPGLVIKHPITGATTATINGTNGMVRAGFFVGDGSGLTGLPSGFAIPGTLVTNGVSETAGSLVKFGTRLTNVVDAASADVQAALGQVYQGTNGLLTYLTGIDTNKFYVNPSNGSISSSSTVSANAVVSTNGILAGTAKSIYAIGDSLTFVGEYPSRLQSLLGDNWIVYNKGISGDKTIDVLNRFNAYVTPIGDAQYVIVLVGVNDLWNTNSPATIESNLQGIYNLGWQGGMKVVAVTVTPWKNFGNWDATLQSNTEAVNTWIRSTATNLYAVADAYVALQNPADTQALLPAYDGGDHLHPNTAGYDALATNIFNSVTFANQRSSQYTMTASSTNAYPMGGLNILNYSTGTNDNVTKYGLSISSVNNYTGSNNVNASLIVKQTSGGATNNFDAIFRGGGSVSVGTPSLYTKSWLDVNAPSTTLGTNRLLSLRYPFGATNTGQLNFSTDHSGVGIDLNRIESVINGAAGELSFKGWNGSVLNELLHLDVNGGTLPNHMALHGATNTATALNILVASGGIAQSWAYAQNSWQLSLREFTSGSDANWCFDITNNSTAYPNVLVLSDKGVGILNPAPTSSFQNNGTAAASTAVGSAITLGETNEVYMLNVDAQNITIPAASGKRGRRYEVWIIGPAASATLVPTGGDLLNGANSNISCTGSNRMWLTRCDGTNWWVTSTTAP